MIDYILEISFDSRVAQLEDELTARLFLTRSTGNTSRDVNGTTVVEAYFDAPLDRDDARYQLRDFDGVELRDEDRERVDWLAHYQQSLEPILIGDDFLVTPDASLIPAGTTRHTLVIPQEQAFGTGSHETTSLCIELLSEIFGGRAYSPPSGAMHTGDKNLADANRRAISPPSEGICLDVGSGSGILALAMLRLGARKVVAFDNDTDAYGALRDNRMRNDVPAERMPLFIGSVEALRGGVFNVVTMNIIPEVILPLLPDVVPHVGGTLLLSGILTVKRDEVERACAVHGLHLAAERERGEWWAAGFVRIK